MAVNIRNWSHRFGSICARTDVMEVTLKTINQQEVRCDQSGDWRITPSGTVIATSLPMRDRRSEFAVLVHELVEAFFCQHHGITDEEVVAFDTLYEKERAEGIHGPYEEDGDDPRAPYRVQHQLATDIERIVCKGLDLDWDIHSSNVEASVAGG